MIFQTHDSPGEIDGIQIEFNIPDFELDFLDVGRVPEDLLYAEQVGQQVKQIQYAHRRDDLNAFHYPMKSGTVADQQQRAVLLCQLATSGSGLDLALLTQLIVNRHLYLDKFQELLETEPEDPEGVGCVSMRDGFVDAVTSENFAALLDLFAQSPAQLSHAKLSAFVSHCLQSSRAKIVLEKLLEDNDVSALSRIAYAMSFFNDVPVDLFPYTDEAKHIVRSLVGPVGEGILKHLFSYYYIGIISQTISKQPYVYEAVNQFIATRRKHIAASLGALVRRVVVCVVVCGCVCLCVLLWLASVRLCVRACVWRWRALRVLRVRVCVVELICTVVCCANMHMCS